MSSFIRSCLLAALALLVACDRAVSQPETQNTGRGCVWVADKPGEPGRLYLCGTIHILREQDYPLAPGYDRAYKDAEKLVFELPPGDPDDQEASKKMRELGVYPPGTTLQSKVSADVWAEVTKWANKRGFPVSAVSNFRPWFLALSISVTEYGALGAKADRGVDQHFETRARKDGKPGQGLETADFQISMFTQLDEKLQEDLLKQTLAEVKSLAEENEKMIAAWKNGDLTALYDMLFEEAEQFPALMDVFLIDRNRSWLEPLEGMLKKGERVMVLVGAGHLAGDVGLIKLLEGRGYRVRHITEVKE